VQAKIDGLNADIANSNAELDKLAEKMKTMRDSESQAQAQTKVSLQEVDKVIMRLQLGDRQAALGPSNGVSAVSSRPPVMQSQSLAPDSTDGLQYLRQLSQSLRASSGGQLPASFLQLSSGGSADTSSTSNVQALEADHKDVVDSIDGAKESFNSEEKNILELVRAERKKLAKLEESLGNQQPVLADKLEQAAETNRTMISAGRAIKRDNNLLDAEKAKCSLQSRATEHHGKLQDQQSTLIRMAVALLKKVDSALVQRASPPAFLQVDASSSAMPEALQDALLSARASIAVQNTQDTGLLQQDSSEDSSVASGQSAGPFDEVKGMIQTLISAMKAQANQDVNQNQFCLESMGKNRRERTAKKNQIDVKTAEIRFAQNAIARLSDQTVFINSETARLQAGIAKAKTDVADETTRINKENEQHSLAIKIMDQTVSVLQQLCGLSAPSLLQTAEATTRGSQCSEAVEMLGEAKGKFSEHSTAGEAYLNEFTQLSDGVTTRMKEATSERELELGRAKTDLASRKEALATAKSDLKSSTADFELIIKGGEDLGKNCGPGVETPEERMRRRQEEIDALRNALSVLSGEAIPVGSSSLLDVSS